MSNKYPPLELMVESGNILKNALSTAILHTVPGTTTADIDKVALSVIQDNGAVSAFLGYSGFPGCCCISVNEEAVHGAPGDRILMEGDIVSIDCGVNYQGAITDACRTVPVGTVSNRASLLIEATRQALIAGISKAVVGNRIGDISYSIQSTAERAGFNVSREFVGHAVGYELHMKPWIFNFGKKSVGALIKKGMFLAIEPVLFDGSWKTKTLSEWKVVSEKGCLSAHTENTVFISENGPVVLTE